MIELYFRPMACSLASRIALEEAGVEARYVRVDLVTKRVLDGDGDFRAITAKGRVPALRLEDGRVLTENAAVLHHIGDLNPDAGLAPPRGSFERGRMLEWLSFVGSELHKTFLYPQFRPGTPDAVKAHARERAVENLTFVASRLEEAPYLVGDRFTVADAYLLWAVLVMRFAGLDLAPSVDAFLDRVMQRPATRTAVMLERELLQDAQLVPSAT